LLGQQKQLNRLVTVNPVLSPCQSLQAGLAVSLVWGTVTSTAAPFDMDDRKTGAQCSGEMDGEVALYTHTRIHMG
jgi:hypothetical protein